MDNNKSDSVLLDGVRSALIAFLITLGFSLVISIIFNISFFEDFNNLMSGNLGGDKGATATSIVRITVMIFNFSLFNTVGTIKFGILIFIFIPVIAFWLANKQINRKGNIDSSNVIVYVISSLIFALLQFFISLITKGNLVEGIPINFATFSNLFTTFILSLLIQLFIKLNYKSDSKNGGINAFKNTYRIMGLIGIIIILVALIMGFGNYSKHGILIIIAIILMLPNMIAYSFFYMIGLTMEFNDKLQEALSKYINIDLTFENNMYIRYLAIIIFALIVAYIVFKMDKDKLIRNAIIYSVSLGIFMGTLGYCSSINFIDIKFIGSIEFSVSNIFLSAFIPFVTVWIIVLIYYLIKKVKDVIKE
ncbi:hypothetical protein [Vallitalea guaymasensis]|uniref:Uncharacterized protein n=1 Tax=Vallitalea guaymasensis TaxID=1185412 RepID=A0A8J8M9X9_9FIRM|nr:hypothetical protein [Vallitalea guaymasensis]QUH29087.1 hypothetical protein HYG85_09195 [Vallitalea guaymasensis]